MNKKDDPAFLYFPTNYRWSMGLLICLSGAPWMGAEIDEVNRVGRALHDQVGDDEAWFAEWKRMGDKVEARGRDAEKAGHKRTAASCFMRASRYYQTGERFKQPRTQESTDTYAKSVQVFAEAAAICCIARASSRSRCRTARPACRRCWCIPTPRRPAASPRPAWCSSTASTSPRSSNTATAFPISRRAASAA